MQKVCIFFEQGLFKINYVILCLTKGLHTYSQVRAYVYVSIYKTFNSLIRRNVLSY